MEAYEIDESTRLPPDGIQPIDDYYEGLAVCQREDKKTTIVYVQLYKPEDDEFYEDPDGSVFAWQNQEEPMELLAWMKKVYSVIHQTEPRTHPRVQSLVEVQPETEFPVLELIPNGSLYNFLDRNPGARVPSGQGSENQFTLQLRWALNIASAITFLHTKNLVYDSISPLAICLRDDFSAVLTRLEGCAHEHMNGIGLARPDGYLAPTQAACPIMERPETWVKPHYDIFAFGSILYYLIKGEDPPAINPAELNFAPVDGLLGAEIMMKCWKKEYSTMDEVLVAVKKLVVEQGLEVVGDDIKVDESVKTLRGTNYWIEMAD